MKARSQASVVLCDFDGTITDVDTGELVLSRFADGDWRRYHEEYLRGAFSFEECLRRQYALMRRVTKASILSLVDEHVQVRAGFEELLAAAEPIGTPVAVASYGLDFCIDHVLGRVRNAEDIQVYSPRTTVGEDGVRLTFPRRRTKESTNLKDDVVRRYKQRGYEVIFVGDGASDFPAVMAADARYAIEGSELAKMCQRNGVECAAVADFWPVAEGLG
ncbi:MAG: HAD-IB family phosphatase [Nitrososphaerota archaeon]|nr:HAD-IB family phosphatase [Nitrososphaerota archaeon]